MQALSLGPSNVTTASKTEDPFLLGEVLLEPLRILLIPNMLSITAVNNCSPLGRLVRLPSFMAEFNLFGIASCLTIDRASLALHQAHLLVKLE